MLAVHRRRPAPPPLRRPTGHGFRSPRVGSASSHRTTRDPHWPPFTASSSAPRRPIRRRGPVPTIDSSCRSSPCVAAPLATPNDWLLKPEHLQHVTRFLMSEGWTPRHVAGLWSRILSGLQLGARWRYCLLDRARNSTSVSLPACSSRAWTAASTSTAGPPRRRPCVRAAAARTTCGSLANACSGRSIDDDLANRRLDRLLRGPARDRGPRRTACRAHQRRRGRDASWTFRSVAAGRGARVARTAAAPRDVSRVHPRAVRRPARPVRSNRHHRHAAIGAILTAAAALKDLGGHRVVVHTSDVPRDGQNVTQRLQAIRDSLQVLAGACQRMDVVLTVESPLPHLIGGSADEFAWLLSDLPSTVAVCLDTGHTTLGHQWRRFS